uniref:maestro heat-like repeat-containing protein family member 1 n=1 Tax=Lonchura striata TaxID=40157 RepID=UPI000B4CD805
MGTALGLWPGKELVRRQLQELLENAQYQEEAEREGLASCFGICARSHPEETLEKLEEFEQSDACRKSQGFFSIFKDQNQLDVERRRAALDQNQLDVERRRAALALCLGRFFPWDQNQLDVERRAALALCLGRVAAAAPPEPRILGCLLRLGRSK